MNKEECEDLLKESDPIEINTTKMVEIDAVSGKELRYNNSMNNKEWLKGDLTIEDIFEFAKSKGFKGGVVETPADKTKLLNEAGTLKHIYGVLVNGTCKHVLGQTSSEVTANRSSVIFANGCAPGHQKAEQCAQLSLHGELTRFIIPTPNATDQEVVNFETEMMLFTGMKEMVADKKGVEKAKWVVPVKVKGAELFDQTYEVLKSKLSGRWNKEILKDQFEDVYAAQGSEMNGWKKKVMNLVWVKQLFGEDGLKAWQYDVKVLMNSYYKEFELTSEEQVLFESKS